MVANRTSRKQGRGDDLQFTKPLKAIVTPRKPRGVPLSNLREKTGSHIRKHRSQAVTFPDHAFYGYTVHVSPHAELQGAGKSTGPRFVPTTNSIDRHRSLGLVIPTLDSTRINGQLVQVDPNLELQLLRNSPGEIERLVYQYGGHLVDFGPDGTAITLLENEVGDEIEIHFRDVLFRRLNIAPGSKFIYAVYETGSGSRSEIRHFEPVWRSYAERKMRADRARTIAQALGILDSDRDI